MTDRPRCGGTPGKPGLAVGSGVMRCIGCADCDPALHGFIPPAPSVAAGPAFCDIHVPDKGRCLHDADEHTWLMCLVCDDEHPFTPAAGPSPSTVEEARIAEIRERAEAATPGPWGWRGHSRYGFDLREIASPQRFAMTFTRLGMRGGQPQFPVNGSMTNARDLCVSSVTYADRVVEIDAPDARFIAHAREDIPWLLDQLQAVRREEQQKAADALAVAKDAWQEAEARAGRVFGLLQASEAALASERTHRERLEEAARAWARAQQAWYDAPPSRYRETEAAYNATHQPLRAAVAALDALAAAPGDAPTPTADMKCRCGCPLGVHDGFVLEGVIEPACYGAQVGLPCSGDTHHSFAPTEGAAHE